MADGRKEYVGCRNPLSKRLRGAGPVISGCTSVFPTQGPTEQRYIHETAVGGAAKKEKQKADQRIPKTPDSVRNSAILPLRGAP